MDHVKGRSTVVSMREAQVLFCALAGAGMAYFASLMEPNEVFGKPFVVALLTAPTAFSLWQFRNADKQKDLANVAEGLKADKEARDKEIQDRRDAAVDDLEESALEVTAVARELRATRRLLIALEGNSVQMVANPPLKEGQAEAIAEQSRLETQLERAKGALGARIAMVRRVYREAKVQELSSLVLELANACEKGEREVVVAMDRLRERLNSVSPTASSQPSEPQPDLGNAPQ